MWKEQVLEVIDRYWLLLKFCKTTLPGWLITSFISRWLKTITTEAGINTNQFKAYSTRLASVSKALSRCISMRY